METPSKPLRKRKLEPSLLKNSMACSRCSKEFNVKVTSSNIKAECIGCLSKLRIEVGGYSLKMPDDQQLQKDFQCPICLLIIRDATELPCNHMMCKSCLVQNEHYLTQTKGWVYKKPILKNLYIEFIEFIYKKKKRKKI